MIDGDVEEISRHSSAAGAASGKAMCELKENV
jgi:hypothetical protein